MPEYIINVCQGWAIYTGGKGKGERRKGKEKEKKKIGERRKEKGKEKGIGERKRDEELDFSRVGLCHLLAYLLLRIYIGKAIFNIK